MRKRNFGNAIFLISRLPGLRLAVPVEELAFKYDGVIYGLHSLPVTW